MRGKNTSFYTTKLGVFVCIVVKYLIVVYKPSWLGIVKTRTLMNSTAHEEGRKYLYIRLSLWIIF